MFFERDLEGLRGRESEQITKRCSAGAAPGSEQCDLFREFLGDATAALHKSWRERERMLFEDTGLRPQHTVYP